MQALMQRRQTLIAIHRTGGAAKRPKRRNDIALDLVQPGQCPHQTFRLHGVGQAHPALNLTLCRLMQQEIAKFLPHRVQCIATRRDAQIMLIGFKVGIIADDGQFQSHRGSEVIEQIAVEVENDHLFIVRHLRVGTIFKLDALAVQSAAKVAHSVAVHFHIRNGLLGGCGDLTVVFCPLYRSCELFALRVCQRRVRSDDQVAAPADAFSQRPAAFPVHREQYAPPPR